MHYKKAPFIQTKNIMHAIQEWLVSWVLNTSLPNQCLLKHLLCSLITTFQLLLNHCGNPQQYLKSTPIFRAILSAFIFTVQLSTAILFFWARHNHSNSSFSILPCLLHKLSCMLNYYHFQSLQCKRIQINMSKEWTVGFCMPGLLHFYLFHFCPFPKWPPVILQSGCLGFPLFFSLIHYALCEIKHSKYNIIW